MKLSARNQLKGRIVQLVKGSVNTEVVIELPCSQQMTSIITNSAAEGLGLEVDQPAIAVIKASSIMIGVEDL